MEEFVHQNADEVKIYFQIRKIYTLNYQTMKMLNYSFTSIIKEARKTK